MKSSGFLHEVQIAKTQKHYVLLQDISEIKTNPPYPKSQILHFWSRFPQGVETEMLPVIVF